MASTLSAGAAPGGPVDPQAPWQLVHEGYTVLVSRPDASFEGRGREGLYDFDTRIVSLHRLTLGGVSPDYIGGGPLDGCRSEVHLTVPRPGGDAAGPHLPQDGWEIVVRRRVGQGMEEQLSVRNHSMAPADSTLTLELDADFADVMTLGSAERRAGRLTRRWDASAQALHLEYRDREGDRELHRAVRVRVVGDAPSVYVRTHVALTFHLHLASRATWSATLVYGSLVDGEWREPLPDHPVGGTERDRLRDEWHGRRVRLESSAPVVDAAFDRAARDLAALRAWEYDVAADAWVPNAGVPTYTGIFGRDTLTVAWQSALLGPELTRGALECLARTQARDDDPWRDEEPGKLVHEMRRGPLSELGIIPHGAYYGEQTAPSMFVVALSEYWHWTGDTDALRRYLPHAERIFEWARRYGDRDGDGLLEYDRRSPKGLKNHGWKDSDEAIRYPDGTVVPNPIATLEEQAFHYIALVRMAEILVVLEDEAGAERFLARACALRERVNDAFWMPDEQFYALALDPAKEPVSSIASNVGHALAAGLIPPERVRAVADRLLGEELFGRYGIRTLAASHPSYNPLAYHLGTVWPVENATFALGLKRHGLDDEVDRLATTFFDAASHFRDARLPEALGGHAPNECSLPIVYPASNAPQAWSASAVVMMVQAMLGLYAFAPAHLLACVRPRLPAWLDWLVLRGVRVGEAVVSLRFERNDDGMAEITVLEQAGKLHVLTVPPPVDLTPSHGGALDRLKEWAVEHAPGRIGRALRIAAGLEL